MQSFSTGASPNPSTRQLNVQGRGAAPETASEQSGNALSVAARYGVADLDFDVETLDEAYLQPRTVTGFRPSFNPAFDWETAFPTIGGSAYALVKRAFDLAFASFAVAVSSPLMLIVALAIKLSSPGPVFFRQERVGQRGQIFNMLKFRTMRVADRNYTDRAWRAVDDPRRTSVGSLLRRTSLDELPQFLNVIRGEMSVVGPRPERPFFVNKFLSEIPSYELRHCGKVGITGLAQIHGYRGDTCIQTRVAYDVEYLRRWSLALDFHIVWMTIKSIFLSTHE
jgi:exopolysaccharide biosynthesis polyprenyl glycosylphosphotransferase